MREGVREGVPHLSMKTPMPTPVVVSAGAPPLWLRSPVSTCEWCHGLVRATDDRVRAELS